MNCILNKYSYFIYILFLLTSCAGSQRSHHNSQSDRREFNVRETAFKILAETYTYLAKPAETEAELRSEISSSKTRDEKKAAQLKLTMLNFYYTVENLSEISSKRGQKNLCSRAWRELEKVTPEDGDRKYPFLLAQTYLSLECGLATKALSIIQPILKRYKVQDLVYYSTHFWQGEIYLEMDQLSKAEKSYRYIQGEIESSLYPLALYRTSHCYWDMEQIDKAEEYLESVLSWIGDKTQPGWVKQLKATTQKELNRISP